MILESQLVLVSFCSKFLCLDIITVPRLVVKRIGNHSDLFESVDVAVAHLLFAYVLLCPEVIHLPVVTGTWLLLFPAKALCFCKNLNFSNIK